MYISEITHVSFIVDDVEQSLQFYRDVLGLSVDVQRPDLGYDGAWLKLGEQQIHLLQLPNSDPVRGRPAHGGRDRHVAFHIDSLAQLKGALGEVNIPFTESRSGRKALFCRDPDGNALEFIEDNP